MDRTHPDSGHPESPGIVPGLQAEIERLQAELDALKAQEPVAWRWIYDESPDSDKCFPMPGPDDDVIARAAAAEFPRGVQYLYAAPKPGETP